MLSTRPRSWWTKLIGSRSTSGVTNWPRRRTSPASAVCTPARILIRVDLPAPFSPRRAVTAPAGSSRSTLSRASVPPNRLVRSLAARSGIVIGSVEEPPLLHAPHREVLLLIPVAGDEGVLVAALGIHVLGRDEI